MVAVAGRSGGANRRTLAEHLEAGTYRASRHADLKLQPPPRACTPAERKRTLRGLTGEGRRVVADLLGALGDWDSSGLATVRLYGESLMRLEQFRSASDTTMLHRELRLNLQLRRSLNLDVVK